MKTHKAFLYIRQDYRIAPRTTVPENHVENPQNSTDFLRHIHPIFPSQEPRQEVKWFLNVVRMADTMLLTSGQGLIDGDQAGQPESSLVLRTSWEESVVPSVGWHDTVFMP